MHETTMHYLLLPQIWPGCSKGWTQRERRVKCPLLQSVPIIFILFHHYGKTPDRAEFSPQQCNKISRFSSQSHTWWCYTALLIDYKIIQQAALFLHLLCSLLPPHSKLAVLQGPGPRVWSPIAEEWPFSLTYIFHRNKATDDTKHRIHRALCASP